MRPILIGDVVALARVLLARPDDDWAQCLSRALRLAEFADVYRQRTGQSHPVFGNGTLMAVAAGFCREPEPAQVQGRYLAALLAVVAAVRERELSFVSDDPRLYASREVRGEGAGHGRATCKGSCCRSCLAEDM